MKNDIKSNATLLSLVFDFLSQLEENELDALLEKKCCLKLQSTQEASNDAKLDEKIAEMVNKQVTMMMGSFKAEEVAEDAEVPKKKGRAPKKDSTVPQMRPSSKKASKAKTKVSASADLESFIDDLKLFESRDSLITELQNKEHSYTKLQRAGSAMGIKNTNKFSRTALIDIIANALLAQQ